MDSHCQFDILAQMVNTLFIKTGLITKNSKKMPTSLRLSQNVYPSPLRGGLHLQVSL